MNKKSIVLLCFCFFLVSCASIISNSTYPVSITSEPKGADIVIVNSSGIEVFQGVTPTTVNLQAKSGFFTGQTYTVSFSKDGFPKCETTIRRRVDGWYFGNIIFGGLIGMLIVDPATGAMWSLESTVQMDLANGKRLSIPEVVEKSSDEDDFSGMSSSVNIVSLNDVPRAYRKHLIPIK